MIKKALSVLPTRPIVYIVPLIVVLVLSFYYWDIYEKCSSNKQFRSSLNALLQSDGSPREFRLADFTDFSWDRVRIVTGFKPEDRKVECPYGWNWAEDERESVIASGFLTVLIFAQAGTIVEYLELRSDEVEFRGADSSVTPKAAIFSTKVNYDNNSGVILDLKKN